jgi:hypothetical protein
MLVAGLDGAGRVGGEDDERQRGDDDRPETDARGSTSTGRIRRHRCVLSDANGLTLCLAGYGRSLRSAIAQTLRSTIVDSRCGVSRAR